MKGTANIIIVMFIIAKFKTTCSALYEMSGVQCIHHSIKVPLLGYIFVHAGEICVSNFWPPTERPLRPVEQ